MNIAPLTAPFFAGIYAILISFPGYEVVELLVSIFQMLMGTFVPFLIIFTCNMLIIITLRKSSKERKKLRQGNSNTDTQHLTRMLIFVSLAYIVSTMPYRLYHLSMKIPAVAALYDLKILYWRKQYVIQIWSLLIVWMCNYCCNFYLYCLGGGRKYRQDAKMVIKELRCRVTVK